MGKVGRLLAPILVALLVWSSPAWVAPAVARNLARSPIQVASWVPGELPESAVSALAPPDDLKARYPWLDGRATVEMKFTHSHPFVVTVYGDHAPITAGHFINLVQQGHYDNAEISADKPFIMRILAPEYVDSRTKTARTLPLEIQPENSTRIVYGRTFADELIDEEVQPVLKNSYRGAIALSHPEGDPNGGSAQLLVSYGNGELIPFNGNELDGNYAVFAYIAADSINYSDPAEDVLEQFEPGDRLEYVKVIDGLDHLHQPA